MRRFIVYLTYYNYIIFIYRHSARKKRFDYSNHTNISVGIEYTLIGKYYVIKQKQVKAYYNNIIPATCYLCLYE